MWQNKENDMADEEKSPSVTVSLKTVTVVVTSAVTLLGAVWAIDNHYASAADISQVQRNMEVQVQTVQRSLETQVRTLRQERADDEIFKLQMKKQAQNGKLSPEDAAMLERFLRRSNETAKEQRAADSAPPPQAAVAK
jgi:hypothetical protein